MRTVIRDLTATTTVPAPTDAVGAGVDPASESVPRVRRTRHGGVRSLDPAARPSSDRRPRGSRPRGVAELYRRGSVRTASARNPRGVHPMDARVAQAELGFAALAVAALLSALVVTALIGLAHWRAGTFQEEAPATVPGVVVHQTDARDPLPR
ncbi:hypothetical protein [Nocardia sp. NPDC005366]|uniref:hypothetical protein n=1 Tax=Nocardia sp. NPDC005366 TaxID=3156878 RepID=UPI0033B4C1E8